MIGGDAAYPYMSGWSAAVVMDDGGWGLGRGLPSRVAVEELPALREYLLTTLDRFTPAQLVSINRRLVKLGGAPVPVPLVKSED